MFGEERLDLVVRADVDGFVGASLIARQYFEAVAVRVFEADRDRVGTARLDVLSAASLARWRADPAWRPGALRRLARLIDGELRTETAA